MNCSCLTLVQKITVVSSIFGFISQLNIFWNHFLLAIKDIDTHWNACNHTLVFEFLCGSFQDPTVIIMVMFWWFIINEMNLINAKWTITQNKYFCHFTEIIWLYGYCAFAQSSSLSKKPHSKNSPLWCWFLNSVLATSKKMISTKEILFQSNVLQIN